MSRSIKVVTGRGQSFFTTPREAKHLLRSGLADIFSKKPFTLKLKDDGYCPEYHEELRYQRGRQVGVTKCPTPDDHAESTDQDWEGNFQLPDRPTTGCKSTRCKPPRQPVDECERDFQRYKTGFLRKQSEEEVERVRLRSG